MEIWIQVVWWIGLAGALLATLVILKQVALVVRELRAIHELAVLTREAARGLAGHAAAVAGLPGLYPPAAQLRQATRRLEEVAGAVAGRLAGLAPNLGGRP